MKSLIKLILIICAIPIILSVTVSLFFGGLGLDFASGSAGSMNFALFPLMFLALVGFAVYWFYKHSKENQYKQVKDQARQEVNQQYGLGDTPEQNIVELLRQKGPMTNDELSQALDINHEEMLELTRRLLTKQQVEQKISNGAAILRAR